MTDKQIKDRVNVKECKYYCNGKCERYEEFVEADYADYRVKCICEKENDLLTYDICDYQQLKRKEQECEELKEAIKTKTGKDYINEIQDITMKYECHQKSMGVCWWGKYGKETKCIGIRECHKRELEVIQKLETTLAQLKAENEILKEKITISSNSDKRTLKIIKTLTEIKEIANSDNHYFSDGTILRYEVVDKILQKISEVKQ